MVRRARRRLRRPPSGRAVLLSAQPGVRLYLVRHGRAARGWADDRDPPIDDWGRQQAKDVAVELDERVAGRAAVVSSPLRRCQETAAPLAARWGVEVRVEPRVAEILTPEGVPMGERVNWLRQAVAGRWADLGSRYGAFRDGIVAFLSSCTEPTVVVSHFIAINAAIGAATDDDRLLIRMVDNCSITVVDVVEGGLVLVEGGHEADTLIR